MIVEKLGDNAYALRNALFAHFRLCRNEAASIARSIIFAKLRVSTEVETSISKKISLFSSTPFIYSPSKL